MSLLGYIKAAATTLGITTVKAEKEEAITHFALGRDVFYYQALLLVFDCLRKVEKKLIVMVVSPLVALMKDQVSTTV